MQVNPEDGVSMIPIEYKKGKVGRWLNDHIQLCAQALCLEERTGASITEGMVFYFGSRRRQPVPLTRELRERTRDSIARAHQLRQSGDIPAPIENVNKCRDCSLEPMCLPREVQMLNAPATLSN